MYTDNFGKQKSFYPDYIVGASDGSIWVIETKGGFTKTGNSEDIDKYTAKKFGVLKSYTEKYKLFGGIVRQDKQSGELCICTETYSDDIKVTVGNCYLMYYKGGEIKMSSQESKKKFRFTFIILQSQSKRIVTIHPLRYATNS